MKVKNTKYSLEKTIFIILKNTWLWKNFIHYEALNDNMAWSYIKELGIRLIRRRHMYVRRI